MSMLIGDPNVLYGRRYRIIAGNVDVSKLHCTFTIEKSMSETPNYSEIVIYNLSALTENTIIQSGERIVVEAGYEGEQYGIIFDGDIVQPLRGKADNTSYTLTLVSQDGDLFLNSGTINQSFDKGQSSKTIVSEVTSKSKNAIEIGEISENLDEQKLTRGKVCFGLARDYLRTAARTEKAAFYVSDRKVQIVKAQDVPKGRVIDLSPSTGLIGAPEQNNEGITAQCLLNPRLNLNSFVHIDNSLVRRAKVQRDSEIKQLDQDGVYRIIKLTHTGDTRGNEWYTSFTGISQSADLPESGESMR
jgi:hypothetical protein